MHQLVVVVAICDDLTAVYSLLSTLVEARAMPSHSRNCTGLSEGNHLRQRRLHLTRCFRVATFFWPTS